MGLAAGALGSPIWFGVRSNYRTICSAKKQTSGIRPFRAWICSLAWCQQSDNTAQHEPDECLSSYSVLRKHPPGPEKMSMYVGHEATVGCNK